MKIFTRSQSFLAIATIILTCNVLSSTGDEHVEEAPESVEPSGDSLLKSEVETQTENVEEEVSPISPPPVVEDENAKIARDLYQAATSMLNSSSPDRHLAWDTMQKSSELGNVDAKIKIAFAKLTGVFFEQVFCFVF
jgi:hypothetical protein